FASKYCRSSTDSGVSRLSSSVSRQVDRNRVSRANRPLGSVAVASMSPALSLTTKVLPSRIFTCPSVIPSPPPPGGRTRGAVAVDEGLVGEQPREDDQRLALPAVPGVALQERGHRVAPAEDRVDHRGAVLPGDALRHA